MLRQGYGIAASTLNVYGNNCQDLLAAETLAMTRARFIENFGPVRSRLDMAVQAAPRQLIRLPTNIPASWTGS